MVNRTNRGTFKPGHSGNPGGRPAVSAELRALARERTPEAMEVLTKIMRDPKAPAAARVAACRELFDRGYGRPDSSVNARIEQVPEMDLTKLTPEQLDHLLGLLKPLEPYFAVLGLSSEHQTEGNGQ